MSVLGESGNCDRGPGESGRDKFHSPGNRGMKKCRGTRGFGDLGFPVEPLGVNVLIIDFIERKEKGKPCFHGSSQNESKRLSPKTRLYTIELCIYYIVVPFVLTTLC